MPDRINARFCLVPMALLLACTCLPLRCDSGKVLQDLRSDDDDRHIAAVNTVLATPAYLSGPAVQRALIQLLQIESNDLHWEYKDESPDYENYYEALGNAVGKIAVQFHSKNAWFTILRSNFNNDSKWADWIEAQAGSTRPLLAASHDPSDSISARSSYMLAKQLTKCRNGQADQSCPQILKHSWQIFVNLRKAAQNQLRPISQLKAVLGLGLCGTPQDIPLLKKARANSADYTIKIFVDRAQKKIQDRNSSQPR